MQQWNKITDIVLVTLGDTTLTLGGLMGAIMLLITGYWISSRVRKLLLHKIAPRFGISAGNGLALASVASYLIIFVTTVSSIGLLGFDLSNLALVGGALSVGIGLGLQNIANNFVSGILLLFDKSIKVGDYVELKDGTRGTIEQIRVRSTIIRTNDDIEAIVPNSYFLTDSVINWTLSSASRRMHIPFGVAYGSNVDRLFATIESLALTLPDAMLNDPERMPRLWFTEMADSSLNFELIIWVKPPATMRPRGTTSVYLRAIHSTLIEHGFDVPFPQRDIHIRSVSASPLVCGRE